jgi:hypothetical protein
VSRGPSSAPEALARLQALVAAEHAAIYGYGVLGARLDDPARALARAAADAHRARRDALARLLRDRGAPVPDPEPAYDVAVAGAPAALALAVQLEEGLAVRWRDLVAETDDRSLRTVGVDGLTEAAVRAAEWRLRLGVVPPSVALPGTA